MPQVVVRPSRTHMESGAGLNSGCPAIGNPTGRTRWTHWRDRAQAGEMGQVLIYVGSLMVLIWGSAHLVPTKSVIRGFGAISDANRNIVAMEWIVEGIALIFVATLVAAVTFIDPTSNISIAVYIVTAGFLATMSVVSLFTGFRIDFMPFKLCPLIFAASGVLISVGWIII